MRELESSVALAAGRYSWGEERVACAHGELSLGGMSEAGPGQGAALSRACGRAAANAIKNPNWLFEAQNHARTDDCVLETHQNDVLDASQHPSSSGPSPVQPALAANFTAAQIDYVGAAVRGGAYEHVYGRLLRKKGRRQPYDGGRA